MLLFAKSWGRWVMKSEWPTVTIGDVAKIKHGFAFKGEFFTGEATLNILVTPGNFAIGGGFQIGKPKYYLGPLPDDYALKEGDVVVTMTDLSKASDTLGYAAKIPITPGVTYWHNQRIGLLQIKDEQRVCKDWLHYLMRTQEYRAWVIGSASGTTVKHTSPSRIESFSFKLPPFKEQRAIAETLGTLDDRITNLRQTNATLEAMAQTLFKSWFVDFDGIPPEDMQESKLGLIPKGWRVSTVGQCFALTMGQSPPGDTYNNTGGGVPFFQGRTDFGFRYPENRKYCTAPARMAEAEDTLVSVRAPVGDINLAWEKCCIGRGVSAIRHLSNARSFTYYSIWSLQDDLKKFEQTGTVFGAINKKQLEALKFIEPDTAAIERYEEIAGALDDKIRSNIAESKTLAQLRNTLLPKLISGQLRVKDAEYFTEAII